MPEPTAAGRLLQQVRHIASPGAFFVALWLALGVVTVSAQTTLPGTIDLSGVWWYQVDESDRGGDPSAPRRVASEADPALSVGTWRSARLPATWEQLGALGHDGSIWFRRDVQLPVGWRSEIAPSGLALSLGPAEGGSYEVWVDGLRVGNSPGGAVQFPRRRVFDLPEDMPGRDRKFVIALRFDRVSDFADPVGQRVVPWTEILLGDASVLHQRAELEERSRRAGLILPDVLAWIFCIAGLYHLLIWTRRRDVKDHFWFGWVAILAGVLTWASVGPFRLTESLLWSRKILAVLENLAPAVLIEFLWSFLLVRVPRWVRVLQWTFLGLALGALVVPWPWVGWLLAIRWLPGFPFVVALSQLVVTEAWRGNTMARLLAPGVGAILITSTAEISLKVFDLGTTQPLPAWAFAIFALNIVLALSSRYTRERTELVSLRQQLERMVDDRTTELRHANERLQAEISERQLAEEAMRMLERAVEQSIDGIAVADLEGNMQFINETWASMHGYEVFELLGYDLNIFHTPEQMSEQMEPLIAEVRRKGSHEAEIEHRRRGGVTFPTWMTATLLQGSEGDGSGIVFIARDIGERKKAEDERVRLESRVKQAEKLESLGSLAGGIAHDYNNILTGVLGNASLVWQELPPDSPLRERLKQIEASAERAADLTDQLLAYAGEEQHVTRLFSMNDLIREQRAAFESVLDGGGSRLDIHLKKELPQIDADPAQITQAILNLLQNAADSLRDEDGVVMLRTSAINAKRSYFDGAILDEGQPEGRYVFFEVSDSGCGMDEETQKKMFDPFFSTKATGRGLGLAAVLGIVRAHRGAIKVYSQPKRGTTVEVLFPVHREEEVVQEESGIFRAWEGTGTALVVDDEELVREVAVKILERQGFNVLRASDGPEALAIFERHRDDIRLVVLDLTMPEMDGETVFREIRKHQTDVKVLLMSGYREKSATQGLEGLAGFLHKPFRPNELLRKVREALLDPAS